MYTKALNLEKVTNVTVLEEEITSELRTLRMTECKSHKVSMSSLKILHLYNSSVSIIEGTFDEIDIQLESKVDVLNVTVKKSKTNMQDSFIGIIEKLRIGSQAKFVAQELNIREIKSFVYEGPTNSDTGYMKESTVKNVHEGAIEIGSGSEDHFLMEDVDISYISDHGITVKGTLEIKDSMIRSVSERGLFVEEKGRLRLNNVTIEGHLISYELRALDGGTMYPLNLCFKNSYVEKIVLWSMLGILILALLGCALYVVWLKCGNRKNSASSSTKYDFSKEEIQLQDGKQNLYTDNPKDGNANDNSETQASNSETVPLSISQRDLELGTPKEIKQPPPDNEEYADIIESQLPQPPANSGPIHPKAPPQPKTMPVSALAHLVQGKHPPNTIQQDDEDVYGDSADFADQQHSGQSVPSHCRDFQSAPHQPEEEDYVDVEGRGGSSPLPPPPPPLATCSSPAYYTDVAPALEPESGGSFLHKNNAYPTPPPLPGQRNQHPVAPPKVTGFRFPPPNQLPPKPSVTSPGFPPSKPSVPARPPVPSNIPPLKTTSQGPKKPPPPPIRMY